jgi:hypothetical protein
MRLELRGPCLAKRAPGRFRGGDCFDVALVIIAAFLGERSRLSSRLDERLQHGFQRYFSLSRASLSALELDPAFVEAIKHLDAGCGVLHALRFE